MIKTLQQMTQDERRLSQLATRVRLPGSQAQIIERYLNAAEISRIEEGTKTDAEGLRRVAKKGKHVERTEFDRLIGNGHNNIRRIAELRRKRPTEMYLHFALELGFFHGEAEHRWLTKKFVGEDAANPCVAIAFLDNSLVVNSNVVLTVRPTRVSKLDHILLSFQEIDWKRTTIDFRERFPLSAIKDAVFALNRKQKRNGNHVIRFSYNGTEIRWAMNEEH